MAISEKKMQIVIDNYFKSECDVNTSIRQAFEKGFRIGVMKGQYSQPSVENKCFDGMTNGEVIQAIFGVMVLTVKGGKVWVERIFFPFDEVWWNAPYKAERGEIR